MTGCINCQITPGYSCDGEQVCSIRCGDGVRAYTEECDKAFISGVADKGCTDKCVPEVGYSCIGPIGSPSMCFSSCGDGIKASD